MHTPDVSVVVPTRNRRELLREAIESVRDQAGVAWELIVVDDASTDSTAEYLAAQADVRAVVLPERQERSAARNEGMRVARGRYVYFLDSDDRLAPGGLAALVRLADQQSGRVVVGGWRHASGSLVTIRPMNARKPVTGTWRDVLFGWTPQLGQMLVPADVGASSGGFDVDLSFAEDLDFILRLSRMNDFAVVPDVVLEWRAHPDQVRPDEAEAIDARIRRRFVDSLSSSDHGVAERLLRARAHYLRGQAHYSDDRYREAFAAFARAMREAPWMARSEMLGRYLRGLSLRTAAGALLPSGLAARIRAQLASRRAG